MNFDKNARNVVAIMYPTGGFGNFLYLLLDRYIECVVKADNANFVFSESGDSHLVKKHVESFKLGAAVKNGAGKFTYNYEIYKSSIADQIAEGKKFLVLADVGNKGDNVSFLRRYFPNATVIRIYAKSFEEKLILWFNCMTKTDVRHETYPGSLLTRQGIQQWANQDHITDQHAIDCMTEFFMNDFAPFGQFFNRPINGVINLPVHHFFSVQSISSMIENVAAELDSRVVDPQGLQSCAMQFVKTQACLRLLDQRITDYPLISKSLHAYRINLAS